MGGTIVVGTIALESNGKWNDETMAMGMGMGMGMEMGARVRARAIARARARARAIGIGMGIEMESVYSVLELSLLRLNEWGEGGESCSLNEKELLVRC